jgi:hypothetical protein
MGVTDRRRKARRATSRRAGAVAAVLALGCIVEIVAAGPVAGAEPAAGDPGLAAPLTQQVRVVILPAPTAPPGEQPGERPPAEVGGIEVIAQGPGGLAYTGGDLVGVAVLAAALVFAGLLMLCATRPRRDPVPRSG